MKFLIVGLGNPGEKYSETRHNIGFKVLDAFVKEQEGAFSVQKHAEIAEVKFKGKTIVCIKPTTFMNLSGKAVNYWMQAEKIALENVLVITDDIALPFGKLRLKGKGSDGGHNGLKDIQFTLNTQEFSRLRFGVGNDFQKGRQAEYVLGNWNNNEQEHLQDRIKISLDIIKSFVSIGLPMTMTQFNQ
jgi:PTH1 family peptidyl-tRNA hydrolase